MYDIWYIERYNMIMLSEVYKLLSIMTVILRLIELA